MHAHHLLARHGKHAERIVLPEIVLDHKGKFAEIGKVIQIARRNTGGIELFLIMRDIVIGMLERPFKPLQLQRKNFIAAGNFDGIQTGSVRRQIVHVPATPFFCTGTCRAAAIKM